MTLVGLKSSPRNLNIETTVVKTEPKPRRLSVVQLLSFGLVFMVIALFEAMAMRARFNASKGERSYVCH